MTGPQTTGTLRVQRMPRWYTGYGELVVTAAVLTLAIALTVGTVTMAVPEGTAFPGPQFFPIIVTVLLYGVGIAHGITVVRSPRRAHAAGEPTEISTDMLEDLGDLDATSEIRVLTPEQIAAARGDGADAGTDVEATPAGTDWRTLGIAVAALAGFIVLLPILGWLISAAALFWVLAWNFGSKRPLFDIAVAAIVASIIQLAFGAGLGLSLPAGILEGAFPWIS
ncbi:tripartite tricarboxylate transporter TctB family protein [Microbacterium sp. bgisy189]|uniref:tripartite tricarboxylate transporter TctB family protein n=1 Tax=Microbacterium sp. bgisy189 TaxID=3413798 RepID=UPI003EBFBF0C